MTNRIEKIEKRWLSNKEAMNYLGVSADFMKTLRENGKVPYYKPFNSKMLWYELKDLDNYILKNRAV